MEPRDIMESDTSAAENNSILQKTRLRARKAITALEDSKLQRGTFVWGRMNKTYWPGIVLTHDDVQLNERKNHYILFWFGDHRLSHVVYSSVEYFAINFKKNYIKGKSKLWQTAIEECITAYGYPYTIGMSYDQLISFANSEQMQKIDFTSNQEELPEFVKLSIYSRRLNRKDNPDRRKKLKKIEYQLPHLINDTCVACLDSLDDNGIPHPLFDSEVCILCARKLKEVLYQIDDGEYTNCFVCGNTQNSKCKNTECEATFCRFCIKTYWMLSPLFSLNYCVICSDITEGLLQLSANYMLKSAIFMLTEESQMSSAVIQADRLPQLKIARKTLTINVLTLFFGYSLGIENFFPPPFNILLSIQCNNLYQNDNSPVEGSLIKFRRKLKTYLNNNILRVASITTKPPIKKKLEHMHVEDLHRKRCRKIARVQLIAGGVNIAQNKFTLFQRSSFTDLFMDFWRVVNLYAEEVDEDILWLYEMPSTLDNEYLELISRYLSCKPKVVTSNGKYSYVWTNLKEDC